MHYADTNLIVATHLHVPEFSPVADRYLRRLGQPVVLGELAELEARGVFIRREGRSDGEGWQRLQSRLDRGEWRREPVAWERLAVKTRELQDKFSARLHVGSFDLLHVAAALSAGCSGFLSFDTNSNARVLAASARLKVWPELSPEEKARVVR